ncbi:MAG: hypothetical protein AUG49_16750 [Catenulispora sp. 13_1_20CM_3_70_7]|nr:MAG: hypothetical protein AUG49_16750 [Catenulispora sp. 13_1_20CM_3_70_7]
MTSSGDDAAERLARVEARLDEIAGRLGALEGDRRSAPRRPVVGLHDDGLHDDGLGDDAGVVTYSGSGQFGPHAVKLRQRQDLATVFAADPETVAHVFGALASPVRIQLVRALLDGQKTSQELRGVLDDASAGQLYHHLRELLAAGLVVQPARSVYAIPFSKVVATCVAVVAALDLAATNHQARPPAPGD